MHINGRISTLILIFIMLFSNVSHAYPNYFETKFENDKVKTYQDVIMLSLDATAVLIDGATRYLDDDNLKATPEIIDGCTYVTLEVAEMLFNAYTENHPDKKQVDFRTETLKLMLNGRNATLNGVKQGKNDYLIYINGREYLPLRRLSKALGKSIYYDNERFILIGSNEVIDKITGTDGYMDYGKKILKSFIPTAQEGKTIYVSPTGKDSSNGSLEQPLKTITKATMKAQAGDTICIREGVYNEVINPINNGAETAPITYKAYNNEKVVITPTKEIKGFKSIAENENIVVADCEYNLGRGRNQVFYKGNALTEARFPNVNLDEYGSDVSPFFPTKGDLKLDYSEQPIVSTSTATEEDGTIVTTSISDYLTTVEKQGESWSEIVKTSYKVSSDLLNNDEVNKWQGATFVSLHGYAWSWGTAIVEKSESGSLYLDKSSIIGNWFTNKDEVINCGYLTGHKNAIDQPGEWVISDGKLYMYLPEGETCDTLTVKVKSEQLCADLRENKYIHLDGLSFIGGGITMDNSEMCIIKNCNMKYISQYDYSTHKKNNDIPEKGIAEAGEAGIYIGGKNDVVRNCTISESAGFGLSLMGIYTLVKNNRITNCGYLAGNGLSIGAKNYDNKWNNSYQNPRGGHVVKYNTVRNSGSAVFVVSSANFGYPIGDQQSVLIPCDISYNDFSNGGLSAIDIGVAYFWGAVMGRRDKPTQLHHNIIYLDIPALKQIHSLIYHDNFINSMETYKNITFYTNKEWGPHNFMGNVEVYVQSRQDYYPTAYAEVDVHDNKTLGYSIGRVSDITDAQYPDSLRFKAGVR